MNPTEGWSETGKTKKKWMDELKGKNILQQPPKQKKSTDKISWRHPVAMGNRIKQSMHTLVLHGTTGESPKQLTS